MSWPFSRLAAMQLPSWAQIVTTTCDHCQTQTTMTMEGSDIIQSGLAGSSDGIIIEMASCWRTEPSYSQEGKLVLHTIVI